MQLVKAKKVLRACEFALAGGRWTNGGGLKPADPLPLYGGRAGPGLKACGCPLRRGPLAHAPTPVRVPKKVPNLLGVLENAQYPTHGATSKACTIPMVCGSLKNMPRPAVNIFRAM